MCQIVPSEQRYHFHNDWLSAYWHFSFDHYYDPDNVSFGPLSVFNDDTIQPGKGFPTHGHKEMEIVTCVLAGELEHRDSTGGHGTIGAGEVQRMTAGTGIRHSEFNASTEAPLHLLQIWILPNEAGLKPGYQQKSFSAQQREGHCFRSCREKITAVLFISIRTLSFIPPYFRLQRNSCLRRNRSGAPICLSSVVPFGWGNMNLMPRQWPRSGRNRGCL